MGVMGMEDITAANNQASREGALKGAASVGPWLRLARSLDQGILRLRPGNIGHPQLSWGSQRIKTTLLLLQTATCLRPGRPKHSLWAFRP